MTYQQAADEAQQRADATGFDHGVIGPDYFGEWSTRMLPGRKHRFGHEMSCEVRSCSDYDRIRPGHGPAGTGD